ncbi:MAG TPA: hypothetical protein PKA07_01855 [Micropruina sp.]|nr:hypothetical protein [Micropruina sp.]
MPTLLTGAGNATAAATSATSLACDKPTNTADGDLLVAYVMFRNTGHTITPPSGWTVVGATENTVFTEGAYVKPVPSAGSESPTSYTWSYSGATARVAIIVARVTGADLTSPIQVAGAWTIGAAGTVTLPSLTATGPGQLIAAFARNFGSTGDATETWGGGLTEALAVTAGTSAITEIFLGQQVISAAGATGTRAISTTAQNATAGQMFIVNPAPPSDTADAGTDQSVAAWDLVTLTGTGSAAGAWSQISGPAVTLGGSGATRTFEAAPSNTPGDSVARVFRYTVGAATDDVTITTASGALFFATAGGLRAARQTFA